MEEKRSIYCLYCKYCTVIEKNEWLTVYCSHGEEEKIVELLGTCEDGEERERKW